jgi:hypothetical protein
MNFEKPKSAKFSEFSEFSEISESKTESKTSESPEINKETERQTTIEEAYKLNSELMKDKVAELTGDKKGEADPDSLLLERDAIRKKMAENGIISEKAAKSLENSYKWGFKIATLNNIKEQLGDRISESEFEGIREIPPEAIELENKGMEIVRDCEDGWVRPGAFREYLGNEIDNIKMRQIKEKIESELKPEEWKPGFETLKKAVRDAKHDMFSRMYSHNEAQLSESQKDWKRRLTERTRDGKISQSEVLDSWMNDPNISRAFNSDLEDYRYKLYRNLNRDQIRANRNINRAEIVGLIDSGKASEMRDKIGQ